MLEAPITEDEALEALVWMGNTTPGMDKIPAAILKTLPFVYVKGVVGIFNLCLQGHQIPEEWSSTLTQAWTCEWEGKIVRPCGRPVYPKAVSDAELVDVEAAREVAMSLLQ
jgi:hypothetical protein